MSKEQFKEFIKDKPYLVDYIDDGSMTWQKFYELYDMYGENYDIWKKYSNKQKTITEYLSKINIKEIESGLEKASKALDIISELTKPTETNPINVPEELKNINTFYGD